jgi:hypothetical protein
MIDENADCFWSRYKQLAPKDCPMLTKTNIFPKVGTVAGAAAIAGTASSY